MIRKKQIVPFLSVKKVYHKSRFRIYIYIHEKMPRQNELQLCLYKSQDYVYIYKWFCDVLTFFFVIFYLMLFRSRVAQNRIYIYKYAELRFFIEHFYLLDHEKLFYVSFLSLVSHGNFLSTRSWLYIYIFRIYVCMSDLLLLQIDVLRRPALMNRKSCRTGHQPETITRKLVSV